VQFSKAHPEKNDADDDQQVAMGVGVLGQARDGAV
jgi:hypothetical protein